MSGKVASRPNGPSTSTTTTSSRQYANGSTGHYPRNRAVAPPPVRYTVESVKDKHGRDQEVLTLEDTPEPAAGANQGYVQATQQRHDPYGGYEPAAKKRKSDAVVGQPYGGGAAGYQQGNGYASGSGAQPQRGYNQEPVTNGSGQKRKHDDYARDNDVRFHPVDSSSRIRRTNRLMPIPAYPPGLSTEREREGEASLESRRRRSFHRQNRRHSD